MTVMSSVDLLKFPWGSAGTKTYPLGFVLPLGEGTRLAWAGEEIPAGTG